MFEWLDRVDWQTWAAVLTVAAACWWFVGRIRQTISKAIHTSKGDISSCGQCPRNPATPESTDVVPLESIGTKKSSKR